MVVITGTDLNGPQHQDALDTLHRYADAIVTLQPLDKERLPKSLQCRTRVILPSVSLPKGLTWRPKKTRTACCLAHLRKVKDPLCLPRALQNKPEWQGLHLGAELEPGWAEQLQSYPRMQWLGDVPHAKALKILSRCACFVISSESEGCSNALCEAIALRMPILASDIPGNRGLLGPDFPGYFPVGDAAALAAKLDDAQPVELLLSPEREADELQQLVRDLTRPA